MSPAPRAASLPAVLLGVALAAGAGCGEPAPEPPSRERESGGLGDTAAVTAARYLTEYAFVGGEAGDRRALLIRAVNETSGTGLSRDYRARLFRATATLDILRLSDTLPVPRAAWRVLPAPGLTLQVADGGEVSGLRLGGRGGELRLSRDEPLGEWTGTTGQREVLARATLSGEGAVRAGILLVRRAARGRDAPPPRDAERLILLADSAGDALVLVQSTAADDTAAAWAWLPDARGSWTGVLLEPAAGPDGRATRKDAPRDGQAPAPAAVPPGGWNLEMPDAELRGRILPAGPVGDDVSDGRVSAEIRTGSGAVFRLHGLAWISRLP